MRTDKRRNGARTNSTTRWNAARAREALDRWHASGLSASAFCAKEGVNVQRLYWWRRRLQREVDGAAVAEPAEAAFIPATLVGTGSTLTLSIAGAVVVEASSASELPSAAWVARVAKALRARS